MKKLFLLSLMFGCLLLSCNKDKNISNKNNRLTGNWTRQLNDDSGVRKIIEQYQFKNDGSYEFAVKAVTPRNYDLLGYVRKTSGQYRINGDLLIFYNSTTYMADQIKSPYASEEKLIKVDDTASETKANYRIENDASKLTITLPCPPNAFFCIGSVIYNRN
ncbi:hypothetical protein KHS38_08840 [Mucilaginibacter sp. Bleaf8]|uniref:hypothetical protein n=1 Tax=Mucilaginibacter sp. Bleaf8 TaxID=2834430 RepID=UPI001BD0ADC4|nr:hypothetical protein [Mucilaginibacter sp. Bleaf8]MBS7564511.1 hypothetical protein [Mucilaginibacter sp. Bleaf8]